MNTLIKKIMLLALPLVSAIAMPLHALIPAEDAFEHLMLAKQGISKAENACMALPGFNPGDKQTDFSYILSTNVSAPMFQVTNGNLKELAINTCKTVWEQEATKTSKYSPETLRALTQLREKLELPLSLSEKIRASLTLGESGCEKIGKLGRTLSGLPANMKDSVMKSCGWYFLGLTVKGKSDTDTNAPRHPKAYEAVRKSADKEDAAGARDRIVSNKYDWQRWLVQKDYKRA